MYESYLVGNHRPLGFSRLRKEKEGCRQDNEQRDENSLEVSHGEEHQLLFVIQASIVKKSWARSGGGGWRGVGERKGETESKSNRWLGSFTCS